MGGVAAAASRAGHNPAVGDLDARDLPRDKLAPYRAEIEGRLRRAAAQARKNGAIDLYLPVQLRNGLPVPASFVVSEGAIPTSSDAEPEQIVSYLVTEGTDAAQVTVDGVTAARSEHAAGPDLDQGIEYGSRRVDYTVPVPGQAGRWLLFAFSTLGRRSRRPGRPAAGAVVRRDDVHVPLGYGVSGGIAGKEPSSA